MAATTTYNTDQPTKKPSAHAPHKIFHRFYFEYSNLNELFDRLTKNNVEVIHPIREHPWGQRAFRIYDPDNHIIEFAESMSNVVLRLHDSGLNLDEIAKKSLMPIEFIKMVLQKK